MKKILLGLLSFFIVLAGFNIVGSFFKKDETVTTTPESTDNTIVNIDNTYDDNYVVSTDETVLTNFKTSWAFEGPTDSYSEATYLNQNCYIKNAGSGVESRLYHDGIQLIKDVSYHISFNAKASENVSLNVYVINADTSEVLSTQSFEVGKDANSYSFDYLMDRESIWNARLSFNMQSDASEYDVEFDHIFVAPNVANNAMKVNQVGYESDDYKSCTFSYNQGDYFRIVNVENGNIVYEGAIVDEKQNTYTNETNYLGYFKELNTPGTYRIESQAGGTSHNFTIGSDMFVNLFKDSLKFFSIQRCGFELDSNLFGDYAHAACHNGLASYIDMPDQTGDVTGGWHDAGDYGRYVQTGIKALNDLLFAYMSNPESFKDDVGISESGNGIPDILDEARYELEWLFKMQADFGGIYGKAVTGNLPGDIAPDEDTQQVYVLSAETTTTGAFVGAAALASELYSEFDAEFAQECKDRAIRAWEYLVNTPTTILENPAGINAGLYRDDSDLDERYYGAMALWYITQEQNYLETARSFLNQDINCGRGLNYLDVGTYGSYLYLQHPNAKNDGLYEVLTGMIIEDANQALSNAQGEGYNSSITTFGWGSNGDVANNGILMMMAYDLTENEDYHNYAIEQLNYLLGKNSLDMSFIIGYGTNYPSNPHHRISKARNLTLTGALVGGPNASKDDTVMQTFGDNVPPAKMYSDQYLSYSTNEVAIYWNSALVHLLAKLGYN